MPTYDIAGSHGEAPAAPEAPEQPKKPVYGSGYKPSEYLNDVRFATCEIKNGQDGIKGTVHFFQAPDYCMKAKGDLEGLKAETEYVLRVTEYGDI